MKIVDIIGGLGNQMLQYSFALSLKHYHPNEEVLVDISHFKGYGLHNGYEINRIFGQQLKTARAFDIMKVSRYMPNYKVSRTMRRFLPLRKSEKIENWHKYYGKYLKDLQRCEGNAYYEGYWHNPRYYGGCENVIRKALTFPDIKDDANKEYAHLISCSESICIHIRRGDYVGATSFTGICDKRYYKNALSYAIKRMEKPVIFVFSNDIPYCEVLLSEYKDIIDVYYVDCNHGQESYRDMQLMTMSKCNIIANSTFSWWGAWLNTRQGHFVVSPSKWVNFTDETGMIPDEWIKI